MRRIVILVVLLGVAGALMPAEALAQIPRTRVFGGFSYLRFSSSGTESVDDVSENLFGLQGNLTYYLTPRVGITFDGAFNTGSILPDDPPEGITDFDLSQTTLLVGPRLILTTSDTFQAEAYVTIGGAIGSIDLRGVNENELPVFLRLDDSVFAVSTGASFDAMINRNWGVRVAQVEVLAAFYDESVTNFRYAGGIVGIF